MEDADSNLTPRLRNLLELLWSEWKILEQQLDGLNDDLERIASARRYQAEDYVRFLASGPHLDGHRGCDRQRSCFP